MYPRVTLGAGLAVLALIAALARHPLGRDPDRAPPRAGWLWAGVALAAAGAFHAQVSAVFVMVPPLAAVFVAAAAAWVRSAALAPFHPAERQQTALDALAPVIARFDPATDTLVLGPRDDETNLRSNHPALFDGVRAVLGFHDGNRRPPFETRMRSRFALRGAAAHLATPPGRLWCLRETDPPLPIPPAASADPALDLLAARGPVVESHAAGRSSFDIHAIAPLSRGPGGGIRLVITVENRVITIGGFSWCATVCDTDSRLQAPRSVARRRARAGEGPGGRGTKAA